MGSEGPEDKDDNNGNGNNNGQGDKTNVEDLKDIHIRSAKQEDNYGASNIVLPCPGS